MRGKPKDGCHRHGSNKHYEQKIVRALLDSVLMATSSL
jgi:hypothetical protein